ncbi:histidine phosphatase family protein [Pediococcus stilesii]|uniref:Histidine phosphatase family protein n=1 Tax=Pediococcus stilesii TaxID=331679 RepID=A0A5R9BWB3_9LACO|nr:histidine phosphatase family protein [Pediococcus stilesii]TLQ04988.1 histidine phosphatase family protein [Pediococcus stilesii]
MTKLYFIRHGKTEWNLEGRYQGAKGDSPLLDESYQEIQQLALFLSSKQFRRIFSSPLRRARITATTLQHQLDEIQGHPTPLTISSRLREFDLGVMEGMRFVDVEKKFPEEVDAFRNHPDQYFPDKIKGETFQHLVERMRPTIIRICEMFPNRDDNVIIVSHGAALNAIINSLLNVPLAELRKRGGLANTSTTILESQDRGLTYQLIDWNDTSYIKKEIDPTDLI